MLSFILGFTIVIYTIVALTYAMNLYIDHEDPNTIVKALFWPIGTYKAIRKNPMKWWTVWDEEN